jgi:hypothetical protein
MQKLSALLICSSIALLTSLELKADTLAAWTFQTSASTNNIIGTGKTPASTQTGILADLVRAQPVPSTLLQDPCGLRLLAMVLLVLGVSTTGLPATITSSHFQRLDTRI